ncbi:MAG: TIGR00266 family protein [Saprospiraceae bacterium]
MNAHEIDYHIHGEEMQFVEIELDPYETVVAEAGSFMMMEDGIELKTIFGDGSAQEEGGVWGKVFSAGKRLLTGESLFMTAFTHGGTGKRKVSFAAPYPGKIIPLDLQELEGKIICQKDAFLCAAKGVSVGIEFSRKMGRGFFGGEGFIMQKLEGDGLAFLHAGGTVIEKELLLGESLRIDTGCLVAFTRDVEYDIQVISGIRNMVFGGEGMFYAHLQGPGKVWIQSLPFSRLADRIVSASQKYGGGSKDEGSVLGGLGKLIGGQ